MRWMIGALLGSVSAYGQGIQIEITGAARAQYKIAVAKPLGDAALSTEIEQVLVGDLRLAGVFELLDPRGFLANVSAEELGIVQQDWLSIGAQGVVKARVGRIGSETQLDARFFEVARPQAPALARQYTGADARSLAHRFANDVYRHLTGEEGVFLTRIAFVRHGGRAKRIVAVDADGGRETVLVDNGADSLLPAWSPSGAALAFTSLLWLNPDAFVMPIGGGRARRISKRPGLNVGPVFSPDGKQIALTLSRDGNAELYLVRADDGTIIRRLTDSPAIDTSPSFSPDGSKLAFVSSRHGSPQIWVMSASGGSQARVTFQGNYNQAPRFSPRRDVSQIAFTGRDEKGHFDVFVADLATRKISRVTQGQGNNFEPTWAPNGKLLAFGSSRGGLWVSTPDGNHQTQIVTGKAETPIWSPMLQ